MLWLHDCSAHPAKVWRYEQGRLLNTGTSTCFSIDGRDARKGTALKLADCEKSAKVDPLSAGRPLHEVMGIPLRELPGLGAELLSVQSEKDGVVEGTVNFAGERNKAVIFKAERGAKVPVLALIPEKLPLSRVITDLKNSRLDKAELFDPVLTVVLNGAVSSALRLKDLPEPVEKAMAPSAGERGIIDLKPGLTLFGRIDAKSSKLKDVLSVFGVRKADLTVKASLPPILVTADHSNPKAFEKFLIRDQATLVSQTKVSLGIPAVKLPVVEKIVTVERPTLTLAGTELPILSGGLEIKLPGKSIPMDGAVRLNTDGSLNMIGKSDINWKKAFGLPFLDLEDVGVRALLQPKSQQVEMALLSTAKVGGASVESEAMLEVSTAGIKDFSIGLNGEIDLGRMAGFKKIPGINEFAFKDMRISKRATYGSVTWKRFNMTGTTALIDVGGTMVMMFRVDGLTAGGLIPGTPEPFKSLKFGQSVLVFSDENLNENEVGDLPPIGQKLLAGLVEGEKDEIPIFKGVSIVAALSKEDIPKPMRDLMDSQMDVFGTLSGPLMVAGSVGDFFGKIPNLTARAKLPNYQFPKNQPLAKLISFEKTGADFFLRLLPASTTFQFGLAGNMELGMPMLNDPKKVDKVNFRGEVIGNVDLVSAGGGLKVSGQMNGRWNSPLGIMEDMYLEDTAIVVGLDSDFAAEVGIGGNVGMKLGKKKKTIRAEQDLVVNVALRGKFPIPKKLGVRFATNQIDLLTYLDLNTVQFRNVLTGPLAETALQVLPGPEKEIALFLQDKLRNADITLESLMQLDKVPVPQVIFKDVEIFFATPGAVIPGREKTLNTIGAVLAGKAELKLQGKTHPIGETENRITLADGLKLYTKVNGQKFGPMEFSDSAINIVASLKEEPKIELYSKANFLGAKSEFDIRVRPIVTTVKSKQDFGSLLQFDFNSFAGTEKLESFSDFAKADFRINSILKSDPQAWLQKEGLGAVRAALSTVGNAAKTVTAELDKAKAEVAKLDNTIETMRTQVRNERRTVTDGLRAAQDRVNSLRRHIDNASRARSANQRKIRSCNQTRRICTIWFFGCRRHDNVPDIFARTRCEIENTPPRLEIVRYTAEIVALEASRATAEAALEVAKQGTNFLPVDADPRVAGPLAARDIAQLSLDAAKLSVAGISAFQGLIDQGVASLKVPESFRLNKGMLKGSLNAALRGKPVILELDFESFGKRFSERIAFSLTDAAYNANQLSVIALGIVTRRIQEEARKIPIIPHALIDAMETVFLDKLYQAERDARKAIEESGGLQLDRLAGFQSVSFDVNVKRKAREVLKQAEQKKQQDMRNMITNIRATKMQEMISAYGEGSQRISIRTKDEETGEFLCLEDTPIKNSRGASKVIFSRCENKPSQTFVIAKNKEVRGIGGRCLDYQEKDQVWLFTCTGHTGMRWEIRNNQLYNPRTDKCLRGIGSKIRSGTQAEIDTCKSRSAWAFDERQKVVSIQSRNEAGDGNLCLQSVSGTNSRGAQKLAFEACRGSTSEVFLLQENKTLLNLEGRCLDPQEKDQLWLYKCTGHSAMRFQIERNRLVHTNTKKCIRGVGAEIRPGAAGELDSCRDRSAWVDG
ncbi:MAG: hypothetical protein ACPGOV_15045 [Magnetovibrionaceae bacterium]